MNTFTAPNSRVVRVCTDELKRIQREEGPEYLVAVVPDQSIAVLQALLERPGQLP